MSDADPENSPLFGLLTDALRAGPGSPEWHHAVTKLRADGSADSDEYRMLVVAREHLASGREYRSVRAGPGFTRKVLAAVDEERRRGNGAARGGPSLANVIAVASGVVVLGLLAALAYQLLSRPGGGGGEPTVEELEQTYFPSELAAARFDGGAAGGGPLPGGWRTVGALPLEVTAAGLRPAAGPGPATNPSPATSPADPVGGAVLVPRTVLSDEPFAVVVQLRPGRPTDDLIVQVFVSAAADFSPDKATSANELVWLLQGSKQKVVVGDRVEVDAARQDPAGGGGKVDPTTVRIVVGKQFAVVSNGAQRLWAGPSRLAGGPRTVGVRFTRLDGKTPVDPTVVLSVRVLKK